MDINPGACNRYTHLVTWTCKMYTPTLHTVVLVMLPIIIRVCPYKTALVRMTFTPIHNRVETR